METTTMQKTTWAIDPMHSEIQFKVKHLLISTVTGTFNSFNGSLVTPGENFENGEINFSIDVNSVDTGQPMRDGHLKTADFFDAEKFPAITFKSTSFKKVKDDLYTVTGELAMHGITQPIEISAEFGGIATDLQGNTKAGFEVTGTINRKDFGLTWNKLTETGGVALGEDIKLIANVQLAKQAGLEKAA